MLKKCSAKLKNIFQAGFGGLLGSLGGLGDKLGGLNEQLYNATKNLPIPGLEEKISEYSEEKMGSCRVRLANQKRKISDKWWKLKGTESGKIHLNLEFFTPTSEPKLETPHFTVLQFYLKDIYGKEWK